MAGLHQLKIQWDYSHVSHFTFSIGRSTYPIVSYPTNTFRNTLSAVLRATSTKFITLSNCIYKLETPLEKQINTFKLSTTTPFTLSNCKFYSAP